MWRRRVWLRNDRTVDVYGPVGVIRSAQVYTSSGLTLGAGNEMTGFYIGKAANEGPNRVASLGAGQSKSILFYGGAQGGIVWTGRTTQTRVRVITAAATDLDTAGEYVDIEIEYVSDRHNPTFTWSSQADQMASGPGEGMREARFPNYDLASIAAGATLQVDFAIAGMAAGDLIDSFSFGSAFSGLSIRSIEAVAGNCRVVFENQTGAPIDSAATTVIIEWSKSLGA